MSHHDFTRRDGSKFTLRLTIDHAKMAEDMARKMALHGQKKATKMSGAVVAEIISETPA